jgi:aminoglycoside phosphotransferase (APT) family kinase protein
MAAEVPPGGLELPATALACVPGLEHGGRPRVTALHGGTVNRVFRIDTPQGRFVLRLDGPEWRRPGVDRTRELALHRTAAAAGVAPVIVHADPAADGLLITEFQDGHVWQAEDYDSPASLEQLGARLAVLHALSVPDVAPFDALGIARAYARAAASLPGGEDRELAAVMRELEEAVRELDQRGSSRTASVVHGDLAAANLLHGTRLWLLDWEYAQRADPLNDMACILAYYPAAHRHREVLLSAAGFRVSLVAEELARRVFVYEALAWLWHRARGEGKLPRPRT